MSQPLKIKSKSESRRLRNPINHSEPLKKRNPVYKSESNIERKPAIKNEAGSVSSQTNHSEPS